MNESTEDWVAEAVDEHQHRLLCYARSLLRDSVAAQDAVQETFLQLCCKARQVAADPNPPTLRQFGERLAPWLFTVCRTRVIDMQRKRTPQAFPRRDSSGDTNESTETAVMDECPGPDEAAMASEEHAQVAACIQTLTPRQQEVLQLRMQGGLSYRQIAEVTGLTTANVGFHLHQAVGRLRNSLASA